MTGIRGQRRHVGVTWRRRRGGGGGGAEAESCRWGGDGGGGGTLSPHAHSAREEETKKKIVQWPTCRRQYPSGGDGQTKRRTTKLTNVVAGNGTPIFFLDRD
jgi:hypothetical protein